MASWDGEDSAARACAAARVLVEALRRPGHGRPKLSPAWARGSLAASATAGVASEYRGAYTDELEDAMNLGELIDVLEKEPQTNTLRFVAPVPMRPGGLSSYRGYYEDLAIEPVADYEEVTVAAFLSSLRAAIGTVYTGYKGGNYRASRDTLVWASAYGDAGRAKIDGLQRDESITFLDLKMEWGK